MTAELQPIRIAILGGGPSGLFMYKRLIESGNTNLVISIFERKQLLGAGMPYSRDGACDEHITNVSGNEIPELFNSISEWIKGQDRDTLNRFHLDPDHFNEYKVLPRLLFGRYLSDQFNLLLHEAKKLGIASKVHYNAAVIDIVDYPEQGVVGVQVAEQGEFQFDRVVICTGHHWPKKHEGQIPGYFDSPYPPAKLAFQTQQPVALKGSSLTAIDALRTLSRHNGHFFRTAEGTLRYALNPESEGFKLIMHSRNGLLPAVRFHLEDSHLSKDSVLSKAEVAEIRAKNGGFLPLDELYRSHFLEPLRINRPEFYERIKSLSIEAFVSEMMNLREDVPAFQLLKAEYAEAAKSIDRKQSVYWKEMLAVLSFAMNYPAKYFSAEDMLRLQKSLMPLISIVIAFAPQGSVEEMMALYDAGILAIVSVREDSSVEPQQDGGVIYRYHNEAGEEVAQRFQIFVDCVGQPHLQYHQIPYASLIEGHAVTPARVRFRDDEQAILEMQRGNEQVSKTIDGQYYLQVPGIAINDNFQLVDRYDALNERIYMMAVPYIGGYNPDYSGLDFGEAASALIVKSILA